MRINNDEFSGESAQNTGKDQYSLTRDWNSFSILNFRVNLELQSRSIAPIS